MGGVESWSQPFQLTPNPKKGSAERVHTSPDSNFLSLAQPGAKLGSLITVIHIPSALATQRRLKQQVELLYSSSETCRRLPGRATTVCL